MSYKTVLSICINLAEMVVGWGALTMAGWQIHTYGIQLIMTLKEPEIV